MTDRRGDHAAHDLFLVASLAGGDLSDVRRDEALRIVQTCGDCAELEADLRAIAVATRDLPVPLRPRDFSLSPEDAARLRRQGWRRTLHALAGPRFALAAPLGGAFASLGVAGLLLASIPGIPLGSMAAGPSPAGPSTTIESDRGGLEASGAPAAAGEDQGQGQSLQSHDRDSAISPVQQAPEASTFAGDGNAEGPGAVNEVASARRPSDATVAILSGSFLIVGLGLFGLRWTARRLDDG